MWYAVKNLFITHEKKSADYLIVMADYTNTARKLWLTVVLRLLESWLTILWQYYTLTVLLIYFDSLTILCFIIY